jgi:hypothetical protein
VAEVCQTCAETQARLQALRGQVAATSTLIRVELEQPTMPWKKLLRASAARLDDALEG